MAKSKKTDPCAYNISEYYKYKTLDQAKQSIEYYDAVRNNISTPQELRQFAREFAKQNSIEMNKKYLKEADTVGKYVMNMDRILNPKWGGDYIQGALSLYENTTSQVSGAGINASSIINVKTKTIIGGLSRDLRKIGFTRAFSTAAFDSEISDVIHSGIPFEGPGAKEINAAAAVIRKFYSTSNFEVNDSGVPVSYRSDYAGPIVHDGSAIHGRKLEWFTWLDKSLDFYKEFPDLKKTEIDQFRAMLASGNPLPDVAVNEVHKILNFSADRIIGKDSIFHSDIPTALDAPISISERKNYAKVFTTWKSGKVINDYLQEFGKFKTLSERATYHSIISAKQIGLSSVFGGDYAKGHKMTVDFVVKLMKYQGMDKKEIGRNVRKLNIAYGLMTTSQAPKPFKLGEVDIGSGLMNFRMAAGTAKLGKSGITSALLDPVNTILQKNVLMRENFIKTTYDTYSGFMAEMVSKSREDLEIAYLYSVNDLATAYDETFKLAGGLNSSASKIQDTLRIASEIVAIGSLGRFFNKSSAINNVKIYTKWLHDAYKEKEINPVMQAELDKYQITSQDLEILGMLDQGKDEGMINIFDLDEITHSDMIDSLYKTENKYGFERNRMELQALKDRISLFVLDKQQTGAPIPGNAQKRQLYGDTLPGELRGEAYRWFWQFKVSAFKAYTDTVVGHTRKLDPEGPQTGIPNFATKESMYNLGAMVGLFSLMGTMAILINAVLNNDEKTLKRFAEFDPTLIPESVARGGGLPVLGDMMSMRNSSSDTIAQVLGSPAISALVAPAGAVKRAIRGKPIPAAIDIGEAIIPGSNLWFVTPFIKGMEDVSINYGKSSGKSNQFGLD